MTYDMISMIGGANVNEDAAICVKCGSRYCFAVADGLGGHKKGDIASRTVLGVFERELDTVDESAMEYLIRSFGIAQSELIAMQKTKSELRTTNVVLSIFNKRFIWGHVGDSRLYHFRNGKLCGRTIDHSVIQLLFLSEKLTEEEMNFHPRRNELFRAMGDPWDSPLYELSNEMKLRKGDAFLLCSDGFWTFLPDSLITQALNDSGNAKDWLTAMRLVVETKGDPTKMDSYSAITVIV